MIMITNDVIDYNGTGLILQIKNLPRECGKLNTVSCTGVTIEGVWIAKRIYCTLVHTTRNYTSQITIPHRLVFSVC
jgi:hypothetical protein